MDEKLTARYYKKDATIAIYNSRCRLIEFPIEERMDWRLPPVDTWKQTEFGAELKFKFTVSPAPVPTL